MSKVSRFANLMGFGAKKAEEDKDDKNAKGEKPTKNDGESEEDYQKRVKEWEDKQDDTPAAVQPKETDPNDQEKLQKAAKAEGFSDGFKAGNDRWATVLSSEAAQGRVVTACNLLADTDMSAENITKSLASMPKETARTTLVDRTRAASTPAPAVDGGQAAADATTPKGRAAAIIAARDRVQGKKPAAV